MGFSNFRPHGKSTLKHDKTASYWLIMSISRLQCEKPMLLHEKLMLQHEFSQAAAWVNPLQFLFTSRSNNFLIQTPIYTNLVSMEILGSIDYIYG